MAKRKTVRKNVRKSKSDKAASWLFLVPTMLFLGVTALLPLLYSVYLLGSSLGKARNIDLFDPDDHGSGCCRYIMADDAGFDNRNHQLSPELSGDSEYHMVKQHKDGDACGHSRQCMAACPMGNDHLCRRIKGIAAG